MYQGSWNFRLIRRANEMGWLRIYTIMRTRLGKLAPLAEAALSGRTIDSLYRDTVATAGCRRYSMYIVTRRAAAASLYARFVS